MKNSKLTLILEILLIIVVFVFIGVVLYDFYEGKNTDKNVEEILIQLDKEIEINTNEISGINNEKLEVNDEKIDAKIQGTVSINSSIVYGKIEIPSIRLKYPILEYNEKNLKNSICNLSGTSINGTGNLSIAGHNTSNGRLFGKLRNVKSGDIIEVTNIYGQKYKYLVFKTTKVDKDDNSLLKFSSEPIITLVTCTNSAKQRLIVQGQLISQN
jgi:sortase A